MQIPLDCAQTFAELTTEIQTAKPSRVSEILYEAGYLMLLAGEAQSAYRAFSHLLSGKFAIAQSNRTLSSYLESLLPSLCHHLNIPHPKTPGQEEQSISELKATIKENEQRYRAILLMDRFLPPPRATEWSEEYIAKLIEAEPDNSELRWFFQDAYRAIQANLRSNRFDRAVRLLKIYELVSQKSELYRRGWEASEVLAIAVHILCTVRN
jgi:hypothetical protein